MKTIAGVFPSEAEAANARRDLKALGISVEEIIVAGGNEKVSARRNMAACAASGAGWLLAVLVRQVVKQGTPVAGAGVGAITGAVFGAIGGLIAHAASSSPISHINIFAVVLGGILIGAFAGAMAAWTYSLGVSHEAAAFSAEAAREHGIVVAAHVQESVETDAMRVMAEHHAMNLRADADPWRASGWSGKHPYEPVYPSDSEFVSDKIPVEEELDY